MLVQHRADHFRLFTQHDHGLMCGDMGHAWCAAGRLPRWAVSACALHDLAWLDRDRSPRWAASQGEPEDFIAVPAIERAAMYRAGIDDVARIDPAAALVCSLHYSGFVAPPLADGFDAFERQRRQTLRADHPTLTDEAMARSLAVLRAIDRLSILACLAAPGSVDGSAPGWTTRPPEVDGVAYVARVLDGDGETFDVGLAPYPFDGAVDTSIRFRDVPRAAVSCEQTLLRAWAEAAVQRTRVRWIPG